jgi:hypothetical protein
MYRTPLLPETLNALYRFLIDRGTARRHVLAAVASAALASTASQSAHAQEYPWCLYREGYLDCFYQTQQQCQWTASGIGGCALNPRLLFPNKPRDSEERLRYKDR